ncbi:MAG TPA: transglutaminaseTgpA domain-containing protein [Ilumatobacteraceae bacterium]|nr:transglutaminaseTgpA domain-containing protein [Ilumatobacteraceae bacterium]HRB03240.1 transglutaminaseTgpA domain-containing protein [Ilumatobacteraceae bacterium]
MSSIAKPTTRLDDAQLPATVCLTALSLATVISLCRVFPDWAFLNDMVLVALGTHTIALLLRIARAHVVVALATLLVAIVELLAVVYYRDTMSGPFPTMRTFDVMRIDLRLVIDLFPTAVAPVPSVGNYAVAGAAAVAICAALADTFAFRAMGRVEAVVPTGVIFIFTSALGTDNHRVGVAALWVATALLTVAILRFRQTSDQTTWMGARRMTLVAALPAVLATFGLTAVVAAAVAPRLPGAGERALVDTRNRHGSVTEVLSPLVDIGAQMRNRGNLELFTVDSSDGGHYWRIYASPQYDNGQWSPLEEDLESMGDRSNEVLVQSPISSQTIRILALGNHNVPAAFHPVSVSPADIRWTDQTQMLLLPDVDLQAGDRIDVQSMVPRPTVDQLRNATVDNAPAGSLDLPGGLPQLAKDEALAATAGAVTPYEKALALQNYFRNNFSYDLDVQYGNSYDAIEAFLRGRSGFCQHFAGTFGVMARYLGLPTRMAVGFTPGDLRSDGLFHVYGRHAHAWPEVWFDGIGWVPFEPTPGRGSPDATDYTNVPPAQFTGNGGDGGSTPLTTPQTVPPRNVGDPEASTTVPGGARPVGAGGTTTTLFAGGSGGRGSSGGSTVPLVFAGLAAAVLAWVLIAPRFVRALSQRHNSTTRDRVISAWQQTLGALSLAGAPQLAGETPLEYATVAELATGADHRALREVAVHVTRAVYSPRDIDEQTAARCELLATEIASVCRDRTSTQLRVKLLFDPRLMRRRFAG